MASSAGLLAGLQSFDSSEADGQESHRLGFTGPGGITFGSLAASFNAEEEDDELDFQANNAGQQQSQEDYTGSIETDESAQPAQIRPKIINKQQHSSLTLALDSNTARIASLPTALSKPVPASDYYSLQSRLKSNNLPSAVLDLSRLEADNSEGASDVIARDASWRNTDVATNRGALKTDGPRANLALRDQEKVCLALHMLTPEC